MFTFEVIHWSQSTEFDGDWLHMPFTDYKEAVTYARTLHFSDQFVHRIIDGERIDCHNVWI